MYLAPKKPDIVITKSRPEFGKKRNGAEFKRTPKKPEFMKKRLKWQRS